MKKILVLLFMFLATNLWAAPSVTGPLPEQPKQVTPPGFTYIGKTENGKYSWYF